METRHPVEGSFDNEFPSICSHCRVIAAWSCKTLEKLLFLRFCKSDPLRGYFQNSVPKVFIATPIDVFCSNFVKFGRREIGEIVRYLPDKKTKFRLAVPLSLLRGSRPKSARQCAQSAPDFIQIGSLSAELYPNARTPTERAPCRVTPEGIKERKMMKSRSVILLLL